MLRHIEIVQQRFCVGEAYLGMLRKVQMRCFEKCINGKHKIHELVFVMGIMIFSESSQNLSSDFYMYQILSSSATIAT